MIKKMNQIYKKLCIGILLFSLSNGLLLAQDKVVSLDEVTVVASRTINNADGYTTNLKGTNIVKGKMAAEVLSFLPNISHEGETYKINGLPVSEIYVNDVKLADISELSNIPGDMIDKVNVKFMAGTEQNAALIGGTIHVTLRRPHDGGYYGSLNSSVEWSRASDFGNANVGSLFYYRYKNFSIYDNIELQHRKTDSNAEQWIDNTDTYSLLKESDQLKGNNFRNRFSFVQQFNSDIKIGGSYLLSVSHPKYNSRVQNDYSWSSISKDIRTVVQDGTLQYSMPLNKRKAFITLTADYFNRTNENRQQNYIEDETVGGITEKNNLNLWKFKADIEYSNRHKQVWKFSTFIQYISSSYTSSNVVANNRFVSNAAPTNTTGFTPNLSAEVSGIIGSWKYIVGLGWQQNRINYENRELGMKNQNTQWGINPLVRLMIPLNKNRSCVLLLNYKRTLDDIPYSAISSVITWEDAYHYTVGNPQLKAPSTDMLMAGLSLFRNKINLTAIYARSHDRLYWQTFQHNVNPDIIYTKPINLEGQDLWGFGAEWMESPTRWWHFKLAGRMEITPENTTIDGVRYDKTHFKEYFYFNNSFNFSRNWGAMLNIDLEPQYNSFDRTYYAVSNVNGRLYKTFQKSNLQFALDFSPFAIRRKMARLVGQNRIITKDTTPVQYINLSVIWKFSGGKKVNVDVVEGIQNYKEIIDKK